MKDLLRFLFPLYTWNSSWGNIWRMLIGVLLCMLIGYSIYLILRVFTSIFSSIVISIKDTKVELDSNKEQNDSGSEKFGIPSCSDYRYRSFYFGLRPYFQHVLSENDIKNCDKNENNKKENEQFIKFYKAELLCYEYFTRRKTLNFFFPWVEYKTLSIKEIDEIEKKVKENSEQTKQ